MHVLFITKDQQNQGHKSTKRDSTKHRTGQDQQIKG